MDDLNDLSKFNIRTLRSTAGVTVMRRFEAYSERSKSCQFNAKKVFKKTIHAVTAINRLDKTQAKRAERNSNALRSDFMVITGHENGLLRIRNFDTGEVVGTCSHFNGSSVSCLCVTNSFIYTAVEANHRASHASDDHSDVYVWDMTRLSSVYMVLSGHSDRVSAITVTPWNEHLLVTGCVGKTIIIWNTLQSKKPIHILEGHQMMVRKILVTKSHILSGSTAGMIRVWNWEGEEQSCVDAHQGPIQYLSFGHQQDTVLSACGGGIIRETSLNQEDGTLQSLWSAKPTKGQILDVAFDARVVVFSTAENGTLYFYNKEKGSTFTAQLHESSVRCIELDPTRSVMITGCDDGVVSVWDFEPVFSGQQPKLLLQNQPHTKSVNFILQDTDHRGRWERIFTSSVDATILTVDFNLTRGAYTKELRYPVLELAEISNTGSLLTTDGAEVSAFNSHEMKHKGDKDETALNETDSFVSGLFEQAHKDTITGIEFSEETMKVITVGLDAVMATYSVTLFDEQKFRYEELVARDAVYELRGAAMCLSHPFGEIVAVGSSKTARGIVELFNFVTGEAVLHFSTGASPKKVSLLGEESTGVTHIVVESITGEICLYDVGGDNIAVIASSSGCPVPPQSSTPTVSSMVSGLPSHSFWMDASFSPARGMVISHQDEVIKETRIVLSGSHDFHETKTSFVSKVRGHVTCCTLLGQAGMHCIVGSNQGVFYILDRAGKLRYTIGWDGGTVGEQEASVPAHRMKRRESYCDIKDEAAKVTKVATCVDANADGRYAVMGFSDGVVIVWDTAHARVLQRFFAHPTAVLKLKLLPERKRIVSISKTLIRM